MLLYRISLVTKTQTLREINKNGKSSIHYDKTEISMGGLNMDHGLRETCSYI